MDSGGVQMRAERHTVVARLCDVKNCDNCPEVLVVDDAPPERRVVIIDDWGGRAEMSQGQFRRLVEMSQGGELDFAWTSESSKDSSNAR